MAQDMTKDMTSHAIAKQLVRNWRTPVHSGTHSSALTSALRTILMLVLMVVGVGQMWGTDITTAEQLNNIGSSGDYIIKADITVSGYTTKTSFSGTLEAAIDPATHMPYRIKSLSVPLFTTLSGTVKNLVLESVNITSGDSNGNTGAIACTANGSARIYNIGILSGSVGGSGNVGGLVGLLDGTARVINCYSFADITSGGSNGKYVGGLVGNNSQISSQTSLNTIVVNCMYYGEISSSCSNIAPVYGNNAIENNNSNGINPYCYFRGDATFNNKTNFPAISNYNRSWPAEEEYLTRFEYYRSILNSNRQLCAYWVTGNSGIGRLSDDAKKILKWVLDPEVAKYPILKEWGKYPSIINPDKTKTIDPRTEVKNEDGTTTTLTPTWSNRPSVSESEDNGDYAFKGGIFKNLTVTVKPGSEAATAVKTAYGTDGKEISLPITDMNIQNHDFGYYKIQLPYYNELFGDPTSTDHDTRYGGNYKANVVTGWKITSVDKEGKNSFVANWESGYNFADRDCTDKDLFVTSGRVFAQGGYYYVPEGVSEITIEAYWGKAVYLANNGRCIDRVNITAQSGNRQVGSAFAPAGTIPSAFQNNTVYTAWHTAVSNLDAATRTGDNLNKTVYDQAVVLLSNFQLKNGNGKVGVDDSHNNSWYPYTIMSIDQDLDNEPDYCFELQFRNTWDRPAIQPIRFDFLPIVELGLAVRHNEQENTIGIFIPQGHFEITETAFMRTTQFEYDGASTRVNSPVILNGGNFEQIVVRKGPQNKTTYFLMGGHFRIKRFTPGAHTNRNDNPKIRLCAVNAIGGEFPEFYLSGIYRPDLTPESVAKQGNPHCYTDGGYFGIMAGAGYDKILGDVTFKIDHSIIDEFYGGGINGSKPIGGNIDVTIDHSLVGKYCGGPKVGPMTEGKTVTTQATGTTFTRYYGGGNGGTSYYREQGYDGNDLAIPNPTATGWTNFCKGTTCAKYEAFNPLNTITETGGPDAVYDNGADKKGYHALYEFECFNESNGLGKNPTLRTYTHWAQFGTTSTGNTTNILKDCIIENDFYGGGNLANVNGWVKSTLTDCKVKGNAFGGGYSGNIEPFRIHDKNSTVFPEVDKAGVMHNGKLEYLKNDDGTDRYYTWCYKDPDTGKMYPEGVIIPDDASTDVNGKATFTNTDDEGNDKWYVLTTVSLEGLGAVSQYTSLTLKGNTKIGTVGDSTTGNVYGGGNESAVDGNSTVKLQGNTEVLGNVFGGGNNAIVGGSSTVKIEKEQEQSGD